MTDKHDTGGLAESTMAIHVILPRHLVERLDALARRERRSRTQQLAVVLDQHLRLAGGGR